MCQNQNNQANPCLAYRTKYKTEDFPKYQELMEKQRKINVPIFNQLRSEMERRRDEGRCFSMADYRGKCVLMRDGSFVLTSGTVMLRSSGKIVEELFFDSREKACEAGNKRFREDYIFSVIKVSDVIKIVVEQALLAGDEFNIAPFQEEEAQNLRAELLRIRDERQEEWERYRGMQEEERRRYLEVVLICFQMREEEERLQRVAEAADPAPVVTPPAPNTGRTPDGMGGIN